MLLSSTILSSQLNKENNCKLSEAFDCLTIRLKFAYKIFKVSLQKEKQTKDYYGLSIGERSFVNKKKMFSCRNILQFIIGMFSSKIDLLQTTSTVKICNKRSIKIVREHQATAHADFLPLRPTQLA